MTERGGRISAVYFGDIPASKSYYETKYGAAEVQAAFDGQENSIRMSAVYYPEINVYQGVENVQLVIRYYQ